MARADSSDRSAESSNAFLSTLLSNPRANSLLPAAGKEDCKQAVIDFVVYQNIPMRKLKRLQQLLEQHSTRKYSQGNRAAVQEKFRAYLLQLKEDHLELTKELLIALRAVKLHEIEEEVRKRFSLASEI